MKIILTDNFDRAGESPGNDEAFIAEGIKNRTLGERMVKGLTRHCSGSSPQWYRLVDDDYVLQVFEI